MANAPTAETGTETEKEKDVVTVAVQVPVEFKALLETTAKSEKRTIAKMIRAIVAGALDYDISTFENRTRTRASKYSTPEERDAARQASAKKRQDTIKALMEKYKKGEISL